VETQEAKKQCLERWINKRLHLLSTYFSYDEIVLEIREGRGAPGILEQGGELGADVVAGIQTPDSKNSTKAGIYLSSDVHCAILKDKMNLFFPKAPTSLSKKNGTTHNFVNERDVQVELTSAFIQQMWQDALNAEDYVKVRPN
jgi:hypothetical protein